MARLVSCVLWFPLDDDDESSVADVLDAVHRAMDSCDYTYEMSVDGVLTRTKEV